MDQKELQIAANAVRAYLACNPRVRAVVREMSALSCSKSATFSEHRAARETIREALWPSNMTDCVLDALLSDYPYSQTEAGLCSRTRNALRYADVLSIRDLASLSEADFLLLRNCGASSLEETKRFLDSHGLGLRGPEE